MDQVQEAVAVAVSARAEAATVAPAVRRNESWSDPLILLFENGLPVAATIVAPGGGED